MMATQSNVELDLWLKVSDVAELRGLSHRMVVQWVRDGFLPSSRPGGGQHLVRLSDLDALLAAGYQPATRGPLATVEAQR